MLVRIREGLKVEDLGGEFLVYDADRSVVHRVSAVDAPWVAQLLSGVTVDVDNAAVHELVAADLLVVVAGEAATTSRRKVLAVAGAATAAVGLTSLLLPSAAAAASVTTSSTSPPTTPTTIALPTDLLIVGQAGTGNTRFPIIFISYTRSSNPVTFSFEITGQITSTVTGTGTGSATPFVPGWDPGEEVTVKVTGTNPAITQATRTVSWPAPT